MILYHTTQGNLNCMHEKLTIDKSNFIGFLEELHSSSDLSSIRSKLSELVAIIDDAYGNSKGIVTTDNNGDTIELSRSYLINELTQIKKTHTLERTKYYLQRLIKGVTEIKTTGINDINLNRWKEYDEILTDSLWVLPKRDSYGAHSSWYWGNFIPQIPHQMMLRYTKAGELVVDPFVGSGTTLLECQRLGRHGIGLELNEDIAGRTREIVKDDGKVTTIIETGNSAEIDFQKLLSDNGFASAQLLLVHPPYHDIIPFSDNPKDLSAQKSVDAFLHLFGNVLDNIYPILDKGRFMAVVIGDKYEKGEWIPLGFYIMQEVLKRKFKLKSTIVKNFEDTTAKRNQKELWRYRAMAGGFYIFKHEYIFVFQKK